MLSLAGCSGTRSGHPGGGGSGGYVGDDAGVDALILALNGFTEELARKVESASDTKAGVSEAQALLDSRKGEMSSQIDAFKKSPKMRDASTRGRWLEAEVDNTQRVSQLRLKYLDASLSDPELKARLERLVADYDAMFKDR
jgi:predicted component of type VI protein secretion system